MLVIVVFINPRLAIFTILQLHVKYFILIILFLVLRIIACTDVRRTEQGRDKEASLSPSPPPISFFHPHKILYLLSRDRTAIHI